MKKLKRMLAVLCVCMLVIGCTACGGPAADKTVTEGNFTITLTEDFTKESDAQGFDWLYSSDKVMVMGVSESQDALSQAGLNITSVEEYGKACASAHDGVDESTVQTSGDMAYVEYDQTVQGVDYSYYCAFYKSDSAFWAVTFATLKGEYDNQRENIVKWASSAVVK